MSEKKTLSLDAFKELVASNEEVKDRIVGRCDMIDLDNGVMRIYREHVNKYLEQYGCKTADDLMDTLYYNYGIYCEVIY